MSLTSSPRDQLLATVVFHQGDHRAITKDLRDKISRGDETVRELLSQIKSKVVTILDPEYPDYLRQTCVEPPYALFYYGDLSLIQDPYQVVTIVGSRDPSPYARACCKKLAEELARKGKIVASGLARGIDTAAAEGSVEVPGASVAFLGNGIDWYYPLENKPLQKRIAQNGLLVSEYPGLTPPSPKNFPARNRLLACVSQAVIVGEAKPHSGTLITAAFALLYNRDVGALPFQAGTLACNNELIKQGAALVETAEDVELMLYRPCPT